MTMLGTACSETGTPHDDVATRADAVLRRAGLASVTDRRQSVADGAFVFVRISPGSSDSADLDVWLDTAVRLKTFMGDQWLASAGHHDSREDIGVVVFGDQRSFDEHCRLSGVADGANGYYDVAARTVLIAEGPENPTVDGNLIHELAHAVMGHSLDTTASRWAWFDEGLAEYVRGCHRNGGFATPSHLTSSVVTLREWRARYGALIDIRDLVACEDCVSTVSMHVVRRRAALGAINASVEYWCTKAMYAQWWLLFAMLNEQERYRDGVLRLVGARRAGTVLWLGTFAEAMELRQQADWDTLQSNYERFLEERLHMEEGRR